MLIETVLNGEKFIKCTLCSAIMRPCDKRGMSGHLSGNKHKKLLQIHKNNLRPIQKPEITEKAETISDLKKRLDDELQRNSTLTDYLTICKLIMNNVQDFSVQPCSKTAFSSQFTSDDEKNYRRDMTTIDYAALFKTQGEIAKNFWKHMELSRNVEINCKSILSTLLEKQTKLGFKPIVEFKKDTNDDEIEVQRGIKIIEELRTIFQARKSEIPDDYRIEIIDWLNFHNKKRIKNLEIEAKEKFKAGIKVERGLEMIERLDFCVKNEIQNLRIQAKKEINNEREIHGGFEMIDKLDVPVNNEISSKSEIKNENKEEMEVHKGLGIIDKFGPPVKKPKLVQEEIVIKYF